MSARIVRLGQTSQTVLEKQDRIRFTDEANGELEVVFHKNAIEVRAIEPTQLVIRPKVSNEVLLSVDHDDDVERWERARQKLTPHDRCGAKPPFGIDATYCYLDAGHDGDHQGFVGQYRSWSDR